MHFFPFGLPVCKAVYIKCSLQLSIFSFFAGSAFLSAVFLALATYQSLYPLTLFAPALLYLLQVDDFCWYPADRSSSSRRQAAAQYCRHLRYKCSCEEMGVILTLSAWEMTNLATVSSSTVLEICAVCMTELARVKNIKQIALGHSSAIVPVFGAFFHGFKMMFWTLRLSCGFPPDEGYLPACISFPAAVHTNQTEKQKLLALHHAVCSPVPVQPGGDHLPLLLPPQLLGFYPICLRVYVSIWILTGFLSSP